MYRYKFVNVQIGDLNAKPKEKYEEVIKKNAKDG
ncbi:DUF4177 domain-containing protein [Lentibacillus amyloliquefaciens]|nr:DUF4177 domain-containing protein [Lentibacillus amyloliquefaciens]